ncbi:MAG: restriction endonuclease subunit S [Fibrobacter sp.]|uniref:restriction endonuclease subunit S n=1 Tax=Fibrobacter sp. TaxID=35828 RepID=UPI0025B92220|nr:restriction endonuclease subunit S [Fibrobacter sp.]MBQ3714947.1 restriction endonuclease subunit S [Fibrobacter sp.]MBQ7078209.1 restriction endonuclease subunit S [Fibrobacter sp.]
MMLPNGWKKVKLGDVAKVTSGGTPLRTQSEYWNGNIPWVKTAQIQNGHISKDQVDEYITELGVNESSAKIVPKGTLLMAMYGQGKTRGQVAILDIDATINQACAAFHLKEDEVLTPYLFQYFLFHYENIRNLSNDGGQKNLSAEIIKKIPLDLPPIEEQKKIAATLSVWDSAIEKMEKLVEAKENSYACFLATSITSDAYAELGTFLTEVSERNKDEKIQQVLSVSNSKGFVLPEEQFDRKVASENLSNYKIVRLGQYAYNPSRINVGSIARLNDWKEAVISPMYTVFEIGDQKQLDSDFLLHWLNSSEAKQRIKNSAQGSVRETVGFGDLCKIKIPKFDLKKQQKIVSVLNTMNQESTLLMQQLENYKKQKQGLMQKLLTGQWRVK